jgi:uncharacterized Tic20 family protein
MNDYRYGGGQRPDYIPTQDERILAMLSHVLTFVAPLLAPLIIYLVKKDESSYVAWHAKESLNFQITIIIICVLLVVTLVGILLLWVVGILAAILVIIATVRASENEWYRYPFSLRLIR